MVPDRHAVQQQVTRRVARNAEPLGTLTVFRALYPEYELATVAGAYLVYPPPGIGMPLMLISDSLGAIARQIAECENADVELADLIADEIDPLPHRPR
jgi:hypothetical protein